MSMKGSENTYKDRYHYDFSLFLRVDERSSDSYIGCDDFFCFFRKSSGSKILFRGLTFLFLFNFQFMSFIKRKANSTQKT